MAKQSGGNTAQRVEALVRPTVEGMGLRLWDVVFEKEGPDWYLRVLIDKTDGTTMDTDRRISVRSSSKLMPDAAISPIPPSLATAAAKRAVDSLIAMPPCIIGTSATSLPIFSTGSFNKYPPFQD